VAGVNAHDAVVARRGALTHQQDIVVHVHPFGVDGVIPYGFALRIDRGDIVCRLLLDNEQTGAGSSTQQAGAGHVKQDTYADSVVNLLIATVAAAWAAQNAAVAAKSLALAIVYIGVLRNQIAEVSELLHLPELLYPLFG